MKEKKKARVRKEGKFYYEEEGRRLNVKKSSESSSHYQSVIRTVGNGGAKSGDQCTNRQEKMAVASLRRECA